MSDIDVGRRIAQVRVRRNMRLADLADVAFLSVDKISKIEHGTRRVSGGELLLLADGLDVSPEDLLYGPMPALFRGDPDQVGAAESVAVFRKFIDDWTTLRALAEFRAKTALE